MDVFRNTGAASLVMMDTDATVYSEEDLKSKLAVPSYMLPFSNYDVTKNTVRQKTANELKNVLDKIIESESFKKYMADIN